MIDNRDMVQEISALLGQMSRALGRSPEEVATLLEGGALDIRLGRDETGHRFVHVAHGEGESRREARVYRDGILHLGDGPAPTSPEGGTPE